MTAAVAQSGVDPTHTPVGAGGAPKAAPFAAWAACPARHQSKSAAA